MMIFLALLWGKLGKYVMGAAAIASLIGGIYLAGRRAADKDHEIDELQDAYKTQERIHDAEINVTPDASLERLRRNGQLRD